MHINESLLQNHNRHPSSDSVDWSQIHGFNYQPSYGRDALDIWLYHFDSTLIREELTRGKEYFPGMNTVRLWLSHEPFFRGPEQFTAHFADVLDICESLGIKAIPTFFNNWHSFPDFGGISPEMIKYWFKSYAHSGTADHYLFKHYLNAVWGQHHDDTRILAWDLCNEPYNNGCPEIIEWLRHTYDWGKSMGVAQPISIGLNSSLQQMQECAAFCDVFMVHPYFATREIIEEGLAFAQSCGKGYLATECCWGSLDDTQRVAHIHNDLSILKAYNIGFLPHALQESLVGDLHRARYASFGVVSHAAYMAFVNMDGSLRPGHDVFNDYCT